MMGRQTLGFARGLIVLYMSVFGSKAPLPIAYGTIGWTVVTVAFATTIPKCFLCFVGLLLTQMTTLMCLRGLAWRGAFIHHRKFSPLRLEYDGSFDPNTNLVGDRFVLKDMDGCMILEGGFPCHSSSALMAEARILLEGFKQAHCFNLQHLRVYTNSLRLINYINSTEATHWLQTLLVDVQLLAS